MEAVANLTFGEAYEAEKNIYCTRYMISLYLLYSIIIGFISPSDCVSCRPTQFGNNEQLFYKVRLNADD